MAKMDQPTRRHFCVVKRYWPMCGEATFGYLVPRYHMAIFRRTSFRLLGCAMTVILAPSFAASEDTAGDARVPEKEIVSEIYRTRAFSIIDSNACREEYTERVCRPDGRPAKHYRVEVVERLGYFTAQSSSLENGCVTMRIVLGPDHHSNSGAQVCHGNLAAIRLKIVFDPVQ